jgi:Arc/MetJ-type ribon-helix-helix transcriptional regulator
MTTISVPIPDDLLQFVDSIISSGEVENRAQAIRKAIRTMREQNEIKEIFEASLQVRQGISHTGDLKSILAKRKHA